MEKTIHVTTESILVPRQMLDALGEFEVVVSEHAITIKSRHLAQRGSQPAGRRRYSFIGIGHTRQPDASARVEEILEKEADRRSGWSLDR